MAAVMRQHATCVQAIGPQLCAAERGDRTMRGSRAKFGRCAVLSASVSASASADRSLLPRATLRSPRLSLGRCAVAMRLLNVAEKPSVASAIASILGEGRARKVSDTHSTIQAQQERERERGCGAVIECRPRAHRRAALCRRFCLAAALASARRRFSLQSRV